MLKADLHLHARGDPKDNIEHTPKDLIRYAAKLNFNILSITNHDDVFWKREVVSYAKKKGILLIPGIERTVKGKHVLFYNITKKEAMNITKLEDIEKIKDHAVVVAPHPYFPKHSCLGKELEDNIELFDAVEWSHCYMPFLNFNLKAKKIIDRYKVPFIGTSDAHNLFQIGHTYTQIDSAKTKDDILEAIIKGKLKLITKPFPYHLFVKLFINIVKHDKKLYKGKSYLP